MKPRDKKIDLDNALLDLFKVDIKGGKPSSLDEALKDELGKDEQENESTGTGWV
jgi:hypothetical protein